MKYNRKTPRKTITVFVIFWSILAIAIIASIINVFGKMINHLPGPFVFVFIIFLLFFVVMAIGAVTTFFRNKNKMFDRIDKSIEVRNKLMEKYENELNIEDDNQEEDNKKYCSSCGSELTEGDRTCPLCGNKN